MISSHLHVRRSFVVIGVVVALVVGAASIRAAAAWAAANAPLNASPATLASIQSALEQEQSRSAALEEQLRTLGEASSDLSAALETARGQVASDTATADELRASLAAAEKKLATLEAALAKAAAARAAAAAAVVVAAPPAAAAAEPAPEPREPDGHEDEHDDD